MLTDEQLHEIRERHYAAEGGVLCDECYDPLPCDAMALLAEVERLRPLAAAGEAIGEAWAKATQEFADAKAAARAERAARQAPDDASV